ncbi:MAG: peptidase U62 [Acidobacteriaceae bacterium]|nr:peptidase U62 [Acidobacteriaceae bacterium]
MRALVVLFATCALAGAQTLPQILNDELQRNFSILKQKADPAPYFMGYEVTDEESVVMAATLGVLETTSQAHNRYLDITIRTGSPKFDNYHMVRGDRVRFTPGAQIPIDDVPAALRQKIWLETDRTYRRAAERFIELKSNSQVKVADKDQSDDFSKEEPAVHEETVPKLKFSEEDWANRLRKLSAGMGKYPGILSSTISLAYRRETKYLVTTEGTRLQFGRTFVTLAIDAEGKAADGMDLEASQNFQAKDFDGLPKPAEVDAAVEKVSSDLAALLKAPVVDPYIGPAILSGSASGVFFHEIFGHRVEGHRQRDEGEGQTFTASVGSSVLPDFLSVVFDPTRSRIGNVELNGAFNFDDEGVKARSVTVVENGILKTFLLSRTPIKGFDRSNGHGRRQAGAEVVSRQSNLIVESKKQVSDAQLRQMLIDEVKRQNKPYGLLFQQVSSGYTTTQRRGLQAFTVIPLLVYRVYADGRPDEMVRGADIVGTPLASFAKIMATSDKPEVFNGYCGAESGSVPVSAISPAILVSEIEIQKKDQSQDRPPLLSRPDTGSPE